MRARALVPLWWSGVLALLIVVGLQVACGGGGAGIQVTVKPTSVTLAPGATQPFTATVTNASNAAVIWQINGIEGGNGALGTISSSGLYTAPTASPFPASVTVIAVSKADSSKSASATVTLATGTPTFSNASLQGAYVFQFQSVSTAMAGAEVPVMAAGRFVADGNGAITSGSEDLNDGTARQIQTVTFSGTYQVQQDGRGTMTLTVPNGSLTFSFVLRPDGSGSLLTTQLSQIGSGQFARQDANALTVASLAGSYAFQRVGNTNINGTVGPYAATGVLTLDANGNLSGSEDVNNQGTVAQNVLVTGTYALTGTGEAAGRVELTVQDTNGASHFAAYIASSSRLLWVETDFPHPVTTGELDRQTSGGFSTASLNGTFVFQQSGASLNHIVAQAGQWHADGTGAITSGELDENNTGAIITADKVTDGTGQVSGDGRFTVTLHSSSAGTTSLAGVLISPQRGFLTSVGAGATGHGALFLQPAAPGAGGFSVADLKAALSGVLTGVTGQGPQTLLLQLKADGAGGLGGTADGHLMGTVNTDQTVGGTYTLDSSGRGVMTLTAGGSTRHLAFYLAGTHVEVVNQEMAELLTGDLASQF